MSIAVPGHAASRSTLGRLTSYGRYAVASGYNHQAPRSARLLQTQSSTADNVPLRKQLKAEAKKKKSNKKAIDVSDTINPIDDARLHNWELTVGLEIHAQLNTKQKLFSGESNKTSTSAED